MALKQHIDAMVAGFGSLRHYGLKDRAILSAMLPGCVYPNPGPTSEYIYERLVTKLLAAGADINHVGATFGRQGRPIELAVQRQNIPIIERLLHDGAQVKFDIRVSCPNRVTNLYGYFLDQVRTPDPQRLARIVALLNAAGLPYQAPVVAANGFGFTYCRPTTLYDEAVNAGNLTLAKAIREAVSSRPGAAPPAQAGTASVAPPGQTTNTQSVSFGAWNVTSGHDGRPVATSKIVGQGDLSLQALRLECVAGNRLEYVPVAGTAGPPTSIWVSGADEIQSELTLLNGRVTGQSAVWLSQTFLKAEAVAKRDGHPNNWGVGVVAGDPNTVGVDVAGTGFSQMRAYMLAHCKY